VTDSDSPIAEKRIRPRIRTAAIVWGLLLAASGAGLAWFMLDPHRVIDVGLRVLLVTPGDVAIAVVGILLLAGVVIVVGSLLSVVHRAQDRRRGSSADGPRSENPAPAPIDGAPTP
jgi:hypothetical protein